MASCDNPSCAVLGDKKCSACHTAIYCSPECAKANWKAHKPICKDIQLDQRVRKQLEAMPLFGKMQTPQEMKAEKLKYEKVNNIKPAMRTDGKPDLCSGCNGRLARTIEQENMDMHAMSFDRGCPDCDYQACESCSCHDSKGNCLCINSNFGTPYCQLKPQWYHGGKTSVYAGDRHPDYMTPQSEGEDMFEKTERKCGNCEKPARMLTKEAVDGYIRESRRWS